MDAHAEFFLLKPTLSSHSSVTGSSSSTGCSANHASASNFSAFHADVFTKAWRPSDSALNFSTPCSAASRSSLLIALPAFVITSLLCFQHPHFAHSPDVLARLVHLPRILVCLTRARRTPLVHRYRVLRAVVFDQLVRRLWLCGHSHKRRISDA